MSKSPVDAVFHEYGTVTMIEPCSPAAREWVNENVYTESWQWMGPSFASEPRMAHDLKHVMESEGFVCEWR